MAKLRRLWGQQLTLSQLGQLDVRLGALFADAVQALMEKEHLRPQDVVAIGCHGQTVWHEPGGDAPHTLQIGDNNQIVAKTGVTVVGDFRRRDIALGGQGAPLVPAFHQALLAHPSERRMVLNIGGIANLSMLIPGQPVRGYDTGPGNMLMDAWVWRQCGQPYDKNAEWASGGESDYPAAAVHAERSLASFPALAPQDVQATLAELTAVSISEQVLLSGGCERLLVCGGGSRNPLVMARLAGLLPGTEVTTTDEAGISGDDMEALAFAWLAWRTIAGLPGNLPSVTGARCSVYNQLLERMQTDTLEYRCDEKPLTVKLNNPRQEASFVYDNKLLTLKQGISASGARYSDGIYVFWSKGDSATVYKRDRIVLNNCQLENPKR
ncbi:hypothetical protein L1887_44844 [Cichorium endivia]|nr:hypothetical protein L1887_44844 [Cichorium endivia]